MYKFCEDLDLEELPATVYRELVDELNVDDNWVRLGNYVAERLELGPGWLKSLRGRGANRGPESPADNLLYQLSIRMCTVGILGDLMEDCGLLRALSTLRETEPLTITRHPNFPCQEVKVSVGKKIQLICEATGLPPASYAWYHGDSILNEVAKELNLEITKEDQEGEYRCLVSQVGLEGKILDQLLSESVYVTVNPTPVVVECQPLPFVEIKKGKSLVLSCKVKSHPEPIYQWFRDNTKLEMQTSSVLKIDNFNSNDEGKYYCYIKNKVSEVYTERSTVIMEIPREKATAKIALLIANEDYDHHDRLKTPKNDVAKLAKLLEEIGFNVICFANLNIQQMKNAMSIFAAALSEGAYGLFYFAGHGFKMQESYVLSVDAPKTFLRSDAICESEILSIMMSKDPALLAVILDTCQTVPPKESNPDIHREIPRVNEYRSRKNLRNLIQAYSTSSHRPSYERSSNENGLYVTHLSKFITKDIPVQKVFEQVGRSIDTWFKGRERNQIPMFALTVTKPYRLTDGIYAKNSSLEPSKLDQLFSFPSKKIEISFQQSGINCQVHISPYLKPFCNIIKLSFHVVDGLSVSLYNLVPIEPNNLFRTKNNEFWIHNPQRNKGPLAIFIERDGNRVGASALKLMDYVPKILQSL
ncbi:mucosa-associated lymphoid tissue lymphoma translocation protein 1 [Diachasma alloeum]|uniref:mucosa-associated lymphoid tissue lymphoma translocation protein 1 n=1 Tax=Diachasma alloeum TaxID=454923 RepID=UPI0007384A98|nr:mucosa-associated lymphoid tissue lymphoma translocation protein 1 [Diachasma alloeum]